MKLVITGVPGTGKTAVAKLVAKRLGLRLVEINAVVARKRLWKGKDKFGSRLVRMGPLEQELRRLMVKEGVLVEGHLACEFDLPADFVIVLRTEPGALEERLSGRDYPKEKTDENVMAEMLDYCTICSLENYPKKSVYEVDTTLLSPEKTASAVMLILKGKGKKYTAGKVSWGKQLEKKITG